MQTYSFVLVLEATSSNIRHGASIVFYVLSYFNSQ